MPPMPPMPPPGGIAGGVFLSGFSATIASVVTSRPATEAAFCNASRTTLAFHVEKRRISAENSDKRPGRWIRNFSTRARLICESG